MRYDRHTGMATVCVAKCLAGGRRSLSAVALAWLLAAALSPGLLARPGDSDRDGKDDLAIGSPLEGLENVGATGGGAVNVLFGASTGITAAEDLLARQQAVGV